MSYVCAFCNCTKIYLVILCTFKCKQFIPAEHGKLYSLINMPLLKVWSSDRRVKKFVVAQDLNSLKIKGICNI